MRIAIGCDHAGFALKAPIVAALESDGDDMLDLIRLHMTGNPGATLDELVQLVRGLTRRA